MSQIYPGVAPLTVHTTGAGAPGVIVSTGAGDVHGNFPIVTEMTGPDKRFAGNLMQPSENIVDRTNWLGWRALDIWAGGDYHTATGTLSLGNPVGWSGIQTFNAAVGFNAGVTFNGATATTFNTSVQFAGANATIEPGTRFLVLSGGVFELDAGTTTSIGADWNRTGPDKPSGATAYRGLRVTAGPITSSTIDGTAQDVLSVPGTFATSIVYTLAVPSVAVRFTATFPLNGLGTVAFKQGSAVIIRDGAGNPVAFAASNPAKSYTLVYDTIAASWFCESQS